VKSYALRCRRGAVQGKVQTGKGASSAGDGKSTGSSQGARQQPASIKQRYARLNLALSAQHRL